jgi:hypothetical protein
MWIQSMIIILQYANWRSKLQQLQLLTHAQTAKMHSPACYTQQSCTAGQAGSAC